MKNVETMKQDLHKNAEQIRSLLDKETRSTEDTEQVDSLMTQSENLRDEIARESRAQQLEMQAKQEEKQQETDERAKTFETFGDFVQAVRFNQGDERLLETREQSMGVGSEGGILVPSMFRDEILSVNAQGGIFRPRATVIPADSQHPDASLTMPVLDQSGQDNMYAGVEVSWIAEGATKPETSASFTDITLNPHEVAGHIVVTDKLLRNSNAINTTVRSMLSGAILASEDDAFLNGNGVGKPLGIIGSAATIAQNRGTASEIHYSDITAMYSKAKFGGSLVWVASQSILPQLMNMKDDDGRLIWQPNASVGSPGSLLGLPVQMNERSPQLGSKGDLTLMDANYYLIKDGSPLAISASEHVFFRSNKTVIKAFWNVDGQSWLKGKITQEGGYEVSPFIILDVPSEG